MSTDGFYDSEDLMPVKGLSEGNEYVESLGGKDLLDKSEPEEKDYAIEDPNANTYYDEQRRAAAIGAAQSLGLTNVGELLHATSQVEAYLKDGTLPDLPSTPLLMPDGPSGPPEPDQALPEHHQV